jgi:predicted  nucleic acid-binding Zn-ribbon protein
MIKKLLSSLGLALKSDLNDAKNRIVYLESEVTGMQNKYLDEQKEIENEKRCNYHKEIRLNNQEHALNEREHSLTQFSAHLKQQKFAMDIHISELKERNQTLYARIQRVTGYNQKLKDKLNKLNTPL